MSSIENVYGESKQKDFEIATAPHNRDREVRLKVGKPGEIEIIDTSQKRTNLKKIGPTKTNKKNNTFVHLGIKKFLDLSKLTQALTLIFLISLIRLFFMKEGILDINSKKILLAEQLLQNNELEKENLELKKEIGRIKNDQRYQRRLAREHLGVIGKGEFLILFSKEGESPK